MAKKPRKIWFSKPRKSPENYEGEMISLRGKNTAAVIVVATKSTIRMHMGIGDMRPDEARLLAQYLLHWSTYGNLNLPPEPTPNPDPVNLNHCPYG